MTEYKHTKEQVPSGVEKDYSLDSLNTFGVPARSRYFFRVTGVKELQDLIETGFYKSMEHIRVLGGGSNVLFTSDFDGLILWVALQGKEVVKENGEHIWIEVGGGENWHSFVRYAVEQNWGGIENLSLIPGMVGAAPIQNIGAYGVELREVFEYLKAVNLKTGKEENFSYDDCQFGYRYSIFKGELKNKYLVTSVVLRLDKKPVPKTHYKALNEVLQEKRISNPDIRKISDLVCEIRQSKLPDPEQRGNAGSFFKNPVIAVSKFKALREKFPDIPSFRVSEDLVKVPAAWLIEQSGMRGYVEGRTGTWPGQALVIVNRGGATGSEIRDFSEKVREMVSKRFGILLENEVNIW